MTAAHQIWKTLPLAPDITQLLPAELTQRLLMEFEGKAQWLLAPNQFSWPDSSFIRPYIEDWRKQLTDAPGALRLQTAESYTDQELRLLYAMISRALGYINNRYTYFFDVMDRGLDYTKEAIPVSKTKAETGYHTDSTAKTYYPDFVGLLCLQPAIQGGESLLANAANLYSFLQTNFPQWNEWMHTPLCRDVITPGTIQNIDAIRANDIPLFQSDEQGGVVFRYMRYWIESAFEKLNNPAPAELTDLLNTIDSFFANAENAMCFRLDRGDMLFVNNRFLCHNRTAFSDGANPRVYVRAWINDSKQD
ncbi:MAG: TauD/TfdA family dioxygenase [Flavobacteriales bacterium]